MDQSDPTSAFIVIKLIAGAYCRRPSFDSSFPTAVEILNQIDRSVNHTTEGLNYQCLYKAMFLFAFNTFPRLGQLTYPGNNVLQFQDVEFGGEKQNQSVSVTFNNFKHNLCGKPHKISFLCGSIGNFGCASVKKIATKTWFTVRSLILFCAKSANAKVNF